MMNKKCIPENPLVSLTPTSIALLCGANRLDGAYTYRRPTIHVLTALSLNIFHTEYIYAAE